MANSVLTHEPARRTHSRMVLERRLFVRHPVSPMRFRLGVGLLTLLLLGFAGYSFSTRDEAIRRRAILFLTEATSGEVQVARAKFRMFGGITLEEVSIAVPFDQRLDPAAKDGRSREIFAAKSLTLIHNPWRLIGAGFHVDQIIATQPTITLLQNVDTGLRNWQLLRSARKAPQAGDSGDRPRITLRSAKAVVASLDSKGRREWRKEELDADVRPHPNSETGYCIEVRRYSEPAERTTVIFDPGARLVTNTPFVDARTVRLQLPKGAQALFDGLSLVGEVKLNRLVYDARATQSENTEIRLRNVACSIPLSLMRSVKGEEVPPSKKRPEEGVIRMTDVKGLLAHKGDRWNVNVSGLVNDARCEVKGGLDLSEGEMAEMGLDLEVRGARVPAPSGSLREQLLADPELPEVVREILEDYSPDGPFDVAFKLVRAAGPKGSLEVVGLFEPQGAKGISRHFPYPLEDIRGRVRAQSNEVLLEEITARNGPANVKVAAQIDRSLAWADVAVQIDAQNVPLDDRLYQALSEEDRSLWNRFRPRGAAHLGIQLWRPGADGSLPKPPWDSHVSAELLDADMLFAEFPYPLRKVTGRIDLTPNRIELYDVVGRQDDAVVRLKGFATIGKVSEPKAEIHLDASDLKLDGLLAGALPPEGRGAFAEFQPEGKVQLAGTVALADAEQGLVYDLRATLCDAAIRYREFPYRIEKVGGEIVIRPDGYSVTDVVGFHGSTRISANGHVRRRGADYVADLTFRGVGLELDQELYDALPPALRNVWHLLKPAGRIDAETALHYVSEGERTWQRHRTVIASQAAKICFQGFPLPLDDVVGQAIVTDEQVEILSMRGKTGYGEVELSGKIDVAGPGYRGALVVRAKDMDFSGALQAAVPEQVRVAMESMGPTGKFDLDLEELRFDLNDAGQGRWEIAGRLSIRESGANLGFALRDVAGTVEGRVSINHRGQSFVQARATLQKATLAGWQLSNVTAKISTDPHTQTLHVQDATADAYGGEATATAEIGLGRRDAEYQASVIARDVQLSHYFRTLDSESDSPEAEGSIFLNMILQGRTGANGYREGAGEMYVRHAQVWRLPLLFAIFQVLNLTPDENVFHDGRMQFYLSRDELTFQQIDLQGHALSLVGGGRMYLDNNKLDVTLVSGSPLRMRLPLVTDLLDVASKDLRQVHVTGTLSKPKITPQPLASLTKALKSVFPDAPRQLSPRPRVSTGDRR